MNYTKPELVLVAPATAVVCGGTKSNFQLQDMAPDTRFHSFPAYEADE
jgi:hypothetical protein